MDQEAIVATTLFPGCQGDLYVLFIYDSSGKLKQWGRGSSDNFSFEGQTAAASVQELSELPI